MQRRARYNAAVVELDELRACKRLARELFGPKGVVEFDCHPVTNKRTGALKIGYFTGPPPKGWTDPLPPHAPKDPNRPRRFVFQGASHRELVDQVRAWRAAGGDA